MNSNIGQTIEQMKEQLMEQNPQFRMWYEYFTNLNMQQTENTQDNQTEKLQLQERIKQLRAYCKLLNKRNEQLASALGACPRCWGEDLNCANCNGEGSPGHFGLHLERFKRIIMPALERNNFLRETISFDKEENKINTN